MKSYQNTYVPIRDKGRFEVNNIQTGSGLLSQRYLVLKKTKVKIPAPPTQVYQIVDGKPLLWLLEVNRNEHYPIEIKNQNIPAKQPIYELDKNKPIYQTNVKGQKDLDENGKPIILGYEPKINELGEPIIEKYEDVMIMQPTLMMRDGKLIKVPNAIVVQNYDPIEFMASEQEFNERFYSKPSFWDKYQNLILTAIGMFGLIVIFWLALKNIVPMFSSLSESLKAFASSNAQVANAITEALRTIHAQSSTTVSTAPPI